MQLASELSKYISVAKTFSRELDIFTIKILSDFDRYFSIK